MGTKEATLLFYIKEDLQEFIRIVLPRLRKGETLKFKTHHKIPQFQRVEVWLEKQETYFHQYNPIYHPDGDGRILMIENLEVRYPDYPHAKDSYIIQVFWGKANNG